MEYYVNIVSICAMAFLGIFVLIAIYQKLFGTTSRYILTRRLNEAHETIMLKTKKIQSLETEMNTIKHNHYQDLEDARRPEQDDGAYAEDH